jgi:hypothetical protein
LATTKIWAIKGDVRSLVKYVENPEKTVEQPDNNLRDLSAVFDYATRDYKTEQKLLVSGINCIPEIAVQQMVQTKKQFGKTDKILAFHAIQSFKPGEVTPQECHEIGMALAREMWGDRFQVVVATHLDKSHLHTHFAINSVSFLDGKKYNSCKAANQRLRDVSDRLCRERSLSVIEHPGKSPSRMLYLAEKRGEPTKYNVFRAAIDKAMDNCVSPYVFQKKLESQGFIVQMSDRRKYATIALPGDKQPTRFVRLGEAYDERQLISKMYHTHYRPQEFVPAKPTPPPQRMQFRGSFKTVKKLTGFRALYNLFLCFWFVVSAGRVFRFRG